MKKISFKINKKDMHSQEKDQFKALLIQEGIDHIDSRFQIFEIFMNHEEHITLEEFCAYVKEKNCDESNDFIQDTLNYMVYYGFAEIKRFDDGLIRYEHKHLGEHHDHMICTKCGVIKEFTNEYMEKLQKSISNDFGFHMLSHKMEIYGICDNCLKNQARLIPLSIAKEGNKLIIKKFEGGRKSQMRLVNMGLRIGDSIEVITNLGHGQMVVAMDQCRFVLGRGIAQKILVERISSSI